MGPNASEKSMFARQVRLNQIYNTLREIGEKELEIDVEKFLNEIIMKYGCTRRKAREYFNAAQFRLENGQQGSEKTNEEGAEERVQDSEAVQG